MKEEWKPIYFIENGKVYDYTGLYDVSNFGRVYSHSKNKYLNEDDNTNAYGYSIVTLYNGNRKTKQISKHRLVALMFIPNPENLPQVNHKDENKLNNRVDNLEWVSASGNTNYGTRNKRVSEKLTNRKDESSVVLQFTKNNEFIKEYPSIAEAERQTGIKKQGITSCCNGKQCVDGKGYLYVRRTAGGYIWRYKDEVTFQHKSIKETERNI